MLSEALARIDSLKAALDELRALDRSMKRLGQKLHLEWNYNSNHVEGNILTHGETFLLLVIPSAFDVGGYYYTGRGGQEKDL